MVSTVARRPTSSAEMRGDAPVAARLEDEARDEDRLSEQLGVMLEGRPKLDPDGPDKQTS
jgi:hypothetical protein